MKLIAIETSTNLATIALCVEGQIYQSQIEGVREHARILLPMLDELMRTHGLQIADLDGIVFGQGPGSFTGIRIACAAALGLAYAHQLPLYPVITTDAIAQAARKVTSYPLLCLQDARMSELYWAFYRDESTQMPKVSAPHEIDIDEDVQVAIAGYGYEQYNDLFSLALKAKVAQMHSIAPTAAMMIERVQAGHVRPSTTLTAEPLYVRNQVIQGAKGG